jgi:hypothetical protein
VGAFDEILAEWVIHILVLLSFVETHHPVLPGEHKLAKLAEGYPGMVPFEGLHAALAILQGGPLLLQLELPEVALSHDGLNHGLYPVLASELVRVAVAVVQFFEFQPAVDELHEPLVLLLRHAERLVGRYVPDRQLHVLGSGQVQRCNDVPQFVLLQGIVPVAVVNAE